MVDVDAEDLLHALLAIGFRHGGLVGEGVGIARTQSHISREQRVAAGIIERLELVPFADGRRIESREVVIGQRRMLVVPFEIVLDLGRRLAGRFMGHGGMERVELVLEEDFPIGLLDDPEAARDDLDLAVWRAVAHVVEGDLAGAQPVDQ